MQIIRLARLGSTTIPLVVLLLAVVFENLGSPSRAIAIQDETTARLANDVSILKNGNFGEWRANLPVGWNIAIGAMDGENQPQSELSQGDGPSIVLSGSANTRAWKLVSQSFNVSPDSMLQVSYSARSRGLKREGRQKSNCYLGFVPKNDRGESISPQFWTIDSNEFESFSRRVSLPQEATQAEIWIFLSMTGTLSVKDVAVKVVDAKDSFDILVDDMQKHYSFFELKNIGWQTYSNSFRQRATEAATPVEFSNVVAEMLGGLNDMHTWVMHEKIRYSNFEGNYQANCDFNMVAKQIQRPSLFKGLGIVGTTGDGFCYVNLRTLTLPLPLMRREPIANDFVPSEEPLTEILARIAENIDASGMIVDIRQNSGGDERIAQRIAGMFVETKTEYAKSVYREGDETSGFGQPFSRTIGPSAEKTFKGPIVCLIGPGTVSSAEALAMMMKATPNCTLIGKPTRGASGNPQPLKLPNGVEVWYSRWQSLLPDGTCIEGVGVQPDIEVNHEPGSDPTFEKAIEILKAKQ